MNLANGKSIKVIRSTILIGAVINVLLAVVKLFVGKLIGSEALFADGIHSFSDLFTDIVILLGAKFWKAPPDKEHPYGHGRIETMINVFISATLFIAAIGIVVETYKNYSTPIVDGDLGWIGLAVAISSIFSKEFLFRYATRKGHLINSRSLVANGWHHRTDMYSSVPVAVAILLQQIFPSYPPVFDAIAAIVVAGMIVHAAYKIVLPSMDELMEKENSSDIKKLLYNIEGNYKEIREIHKIKSRSVGESVFVELHMLFDPEVHVIKAHSICEKFKQDVFSMSPRISDISIHIEPFVEDLHKDF